MSGGSVRVILKVTLLPPVPCHTASEDGSPPCKRTHEVPQSWSDLVSIPSTPGSELGVGQSSEVKVWGHPSLHCYCCKSVNWRKKLEKVSRSRVQIMEQLAGHPWRQPGSSAHQLQHSERRTQSTVPSSWATGHTDCLADSHELAALSRAVRFNTRVFHGECVHSPGESTRVVRGLLGLCVPMFLHQHW